MRGLMRGSPEAGACHRREIQLYWTKISLSSHPPLSPDEGTDMVKYVYHDRDMDTVPRI